MGVDFKPARDIPDLSGKVVLVTGGNAGIGASFIKFLAAHSPSVIYLCARTPSKAEPVIEAIQQDHPDAKIETLQLDLASFESVRACAAKFLERSDRLDLLFLNAGIAMTDPALTKEGYETTWGTNHVGHALFCQLLMPTVLRTAQKPGSDTRIIVTSSIACYRFIEPTGLNLDLMKSTATELKPYVRYGNSKLANVLFARKLSQLYPQVTTTSHHPGTVLTDIWSKVDSKLKYLIKVLWPVLWLTGTDADAGALTGLW